MFSCNKASWAHGKYHRSGRSANSEANTQPEKKFRKNQTAVGLCMPHVLVRSLPRPRAKQLAQDACINAFSLRSGRMHVKAAHWFVAASLFNPTSLPQWDDERFIYRLSFRQDVACACTRSTDAVNDHGRIGQGKINWTSHAHTRERSLETLKALFTSRGWDGRGLFRIPKFSW
jgi:hypothetical protein